MSTARPKCYGVTADRRACVLAWPHYGEDHQGAGAGATTDGRTDSERAAS